MARKQKTIHYIYRTTCKVTGRYYIGMHSTDNLNDGYMGSGRRLRRSIRKHGEENHIKEILEFLPNRDMLIEREKEMITLDMIIDDNCMNLMSGGTGGFISDEQQRHRSECGGKAFALRLKNDIKFCILIGNNISIRLKKAYKDGKREIKYFYDWTDKKQSIKHKKNISKSKKNKCLGESNSQYGTCWITKGGINKKIKKEKLKKYMNEGWVNGRKLK